MARRSEHVCRGDRELTEVESLLAEAGDGSFLERLAWQAAESRSESAWIAGMSALSAMIRARDAELPLGVAAVVALTPVAMSERLREGAPAGFETKGAVREEPLGSRASS